MQDTLRDEIYSLLDHVKHQVKKNKKHRRNLVIQGDKKYLVGYVEFPNLSALMLVKLLLEYNTNDYTFTWNRNLCRYENRQYIMYEDASLEIISQQTKNKIKTFLKFLKTIKRDIPFFLKQLRSNWIRVSEIGFITYLRKNVYLCHKNPKSLRHPMLSAMEDYCRSEDVFWRHVLVVLGLEHDEDQRGTLKISRGYASDESVWNFILITPNYKNLVENILGLTVAADAKTHEEVVGICELSAGQEDSYLL